MSVAGHSSTAVLSAEPELMRGVPPADADALRGLEVPCVQEPKGRWLPAAPAAYGPETFALTVLEGFLLREVRVGPRVSAHVLGPGDVVDPWVDAPGAFTSAGRWTVHVPVTLAALGASYLAAARRWPVLLVRVHARAAAQADRTRHESAIRDLRHVEERIVALCFHVAEQWGAVAPDALVMPFELTHQQLGRLVAAERPTVTAALTDLLRRGVVERTPAGPWRLPVAARALVPAAGAG